MQNLQHGCSLPVYGYLHAYACTAKPISCFNHRVVSLVADKLEVVVRRGSESTEVCIKLATNTAEHC